ncbi:MAG: large subunit ribosomal protein L24 [Candidatus Berkelbacteria bacterium Licking1014_7]|uniref:Large ribosomal subunit protein uL24 n=1 Tax=Candidatus Berkelbacteria bacterium Licking1014_7 TaxID=2017147 RepID=A0A554LKI1_9BACT|nr:MAG: large subunit ribosomal protein L24 [Candidatus Berkelbacteria bacterium Licking1014_7]
MNYKTKIKKGDTVRICAGKDRGKMVVANKVFAKNRKVWLDGANILKKNAKPSSKYPKGGIVDIQHPIDISNVRIICPNCQKITKIKIKIDSGKKIRYCAKCLKNLDRPTAK